MPSVSIITPAFRAIDCIARPVQSAIAQTYQDWEMIIVSDDGQDYKSALHALGISDSRVRFASTGGIGKGPSHGRNVALEMARGRFIAPLDADDALVPRKLEVMLEAAASHGAAISAMAVIDEGTGKEVENFQRRIPDGSITCRDVFSLNAYGNTNVIFDRQRIPSLRWPEQVSRCEDLVFNVCLFDFITEFYYFSEPLHQYYIRQNSLCRNTESTVGFMHDRELLVRLLQAGEITISNAGNRKMLMDFLQACNEVNILSEGRAFSYKEYIENIRKLCSFFE